MTTDKLNKTYLSLDPDSQKQVDELLLSLKKQKESPQKIKQRKFGCAKGFFKVMPGFDEPINFKD